MFVRTYKPQLFTVVAPEMYILDLFVADKKYKLEHERESKTWLLYDSNSTQMFISTYGFFHAYIIELDFPCLFHVPARILS